MFSGTRTRGFSPSEAAKQSRSTGNTVRASLAESDSGRQPEIPASPAPAGAAVRIRADVWADNWFAFYIGNRFVAEDSVSILSERSFNAETFEFDAAYPLQLNFVVKDFIQNDTGLEYIGRRNQQMGDGGLIAQFTDVNTGEVVAVTDYRWNTYVIHRAPLGSGCADERNPVAGQSPCRFTSVDEPTGWKALNYEDKAWNSAIEYSAATVRPKGGYNQIRWAANSNFIWSSDLEKDNTVLCRLTVDEPE